MHPNGTIVGVASIPDYLSDLNAMHEAEKSLTIGAQAQYLNQLEEVTGGGKFGTWWECLWCCHHATAAQRAEAFLRALGLWTTEP